MATLMSFSFVLLIPLASQCCFNVHPSPSRCVVCMNLSGCAELKQTHVSVDRSAFSGSFALMLFESVPVLTGNPINRLCHCTNCRDRGRGKNRRGKTTETNSRVNSNDHKVMRYISRTLCRQLDLACKTRLFLVPLTRNVFYVHPNSGLSNTTHTCADKISVKLKNKAGEGMFGGRQSKSRKIGSTCFPSNSYATTAANVSSRSTTQVTCQSNLG